MSNDFLAAADNARRLLRGFADVERVAKAFETVGKLVQQRDETKSELAALNTKVSNAVSTLNDTLAQQSAAEAALAQAKADGEAALADVKARCEAMVSEADAAAKLVLESVAGERDKLQAETAAANNDVIERRNLLTAECEALESRLAAAKEAMRQALQGTAPTPPVIDTP